MIKNNIKKIALINTFFMLMAIAMPFSVSSVHAANLAHASMRPDRMAISLSTSYLVVITPTTVGTEASTKVTFAAGYDVSGATASTTGLPATYHGLTVNAVPTVGTATIAGQAVTVPHGELTVGTTYAFYINVVVNPGTTGQKVNTIATQTSAPATIDSSSVATYIVSDNSTATDSDQIVVTASVGPTYTLILDRNAVSLTTTTSTVEYPGGTNNGAVAAVLATATTNAEDGHIMWIKAGGTGLTSTTTGVTIPYAPTAADGSPSTLAAGTAGVVIDVDLTTNGSGSLAIAGEFNGGSTSAGGTPNTTFQEIADADGPTLGDEVTIIPRVAISTSTPAADDYTDTLTVVGAGDF